MKRLFLILALLCVGLFVSASSVIIRDTTIQNSDKLKFEFYFSHFECGISICKYPTNFDVGAIENSFLPGSYAYKASISFTPKVNFVGLDTIDFLSGCSSSPVDRYFDTLRYIVRLRATNIIVDHYKVRIIQDPSNSLIQIQGISIDSQLKIELFDLNGRICQSDIVVGDRFAVKVNNGIYILRICSENLKVLEEKIQINNNCP